MFTLLKSKVYLFEGKNNSLKELFLAKLLQNFDQVIYVTCNRSASNSIQRLIEIDISANSIAKSYHFIDCISNSIGLKQKETAENITYCNQSLNDISLTISKILDKKAPAKKSVLVLDNLTIFYLYHQDAFQQFMHTLTGRLREWGGSTVYLLDPEALEEHTTKSVETLVDEVVKLYLEEAKLVISHSLEKTSIPITELAPRRQLPKPVSIMPPDFFTKSTPVREHRNEMGRQINLFWTQLANFASLLIDQNLPLYIYSTNKQYSRQWHLSIMEKKGIAGKGWKVKGFDVAAIAENFAAKGPVLFGESDLQLNLEKSSKDRLLVEEHNCLDCWQLTDNINSMICWAAAGMAAGAVEAISGVNVESIETTCKANGNSHCEFTIGDFSESNIIEYYNTSVRRFKVNDAVNSLSKIVESFLVKGEPPVQRNQLGVSHDFIGLQLRTSLPCIGNENYSKWLFEGAKLVSQKIYTHLADAGVKSPIEVLLKFIDQSKVGKVTHTKAYDKITVEGSAESFGLSATKPSCNFLRGYLSGMMEEHTGKPIEYIETTCIATKEQHCTFEKI